jgi:hypothetical protein
LNCGTIFVVDEDRESVQRRNKEAHAAERGLEVVLMPLYPGQKETRRAKVHPLQIAAIEDWVA